MSGRTCQECGGLIVAPDEQEISELVCQRCGLVVGAMERDSAQEIE